MRILVNLSVKLILSNHDKSQIPHDMSCWLRFLTLDVIFGLVLAFIGGLFTLFVFSKLKAVSASNDQTKARFRAFGVSMKDS